MSLLFSVSQRQLMRNLRPLQLVETRREVLVCNARVAEWFAVEVDERKGIANLLLQLPGVVMLGSRENRVHLSVKRIDHKVDRRLAPIGLRIFARRRRSVSDHDLGAVARAFQLLPSICVTEFVG